MVPTALYDGSQCSSLTLITRFIRKIAVTVRLGYTACAARRFLKIDRLAPQRGAFLNLMQFGVN
jgi:hypothetical protein